MRILESGIVPMDTATFDDESASKWVVEQVERMRRSGRSDCDNRPDARVAVARDIGISPGTVENIDRKRLRRSLQTIIRDKIQEHKIRFLEAEIRRNMNELERARKTGSPRLQKHISALEVSTSEAQSVLEAVLRQ